MKVLDTRRTRIIELLERDGSVRVEDLAAKFQVSLVTIRKDLTELESRGLLERTHGGAIFTHKSRFNPSFLEKVKLQPDEKNAIAQAALEFVREGDAIILDAGSTTLALAKAMKNQFRSLYVLTNSVAIALELVGTPWEIVLLGGQVRHHSLALIGPSTVALLETYHVDKAFLGTTGVSLDRGYTTPNPLEAQTKRAMLLAARERIVLADASKLGHATLTSFARVNEIDLLITASHGPPDFLTGLERQGRRYRVAALNGHGVFHAVSSEHLNGRP
jgi:DeoR family transcriptional regulator of aga operon/DeoR family fructose operon transcriptional repressor